MGSIDGKVERKNGSIILINDASEEELCWNFRDGWQTKWTGPSFNPTGNEVMIATLEIAHEGVD
jgi:phage tail-like protein